MLVPLGSFPLFPLLQLRGERATAARLRLPATISRAPFLSGGQSGVGEGGRPGNRYADVYRLGRLLSRSRVAGGEVLDFVRERMKVAALFPCWPGFLPLAAGDGGAAGRILFLPLVVGDGGAAERILFLRELPGEFFASDFSCEVGWSPSVGVLMDLLLWILFLVVVAAAGFTGVGVAFWKSGMAAADGVGAEDADDCDQVLRISCSLPTFGVRSLFRHGEERRLEVRMLCSMASEAEAEATAKEGDKQ